MQIIETRKALIWLDLRKQAQSATEAEHMWKATRDGQDEIRLKWTLRRIDKLSSAIATKLRVMEAELRNQV
jgi:hypothetical protein